MGNPLFCSRSLQHHAEKKALAILLANDAPALDVSINFNACMDCHEFFTVSSQLLSRKILLCQPKMTHMFTDGHCSCNDLWSLQSRLTSAKQEIAVAVQRRQELDVEGAKTRRKVTKHAACTAATEEQHLDAVKERRSNVAKLMVAAVVEEPQLIPKMIPK